MYEMSLLAVLGALIYIPAQHLLKSMCLYICFLLKLLRKNPKISHENEFTNYTKKCEGRGHFSLPCI